MNNRPFNPKRPLNQLTGKVLKAAMEVHSSLGPGLLESAYEACLLMELREMNLEIEHQLILPIFFKGKKIDIGYRIDLLIEKQVIVELKAVEKLQPIHKAQLMSYLKLSRLPVGLLLNFNVVHLRDGFERLVMN